jgi:hypothetical protein
MAGRQAQPAQLAGGKFGCLCSSTFPAPQQQSKAREPDLDYRRVVKRSRAVAKGRNDGDKAGSIRSLGRTGPK